MTKRNNLTPTKRGALLAAAILTSSIAHTFAGTDISKTVVAPTVVEKVP